MKVLDHILGRQECSVVSSLTASESRSLYSLVLPGLSLRLLVLLRGAYHCRPELYVVSFHRSMFKKLDTVYAACRWIHNRRVYHSNIPGQHALINHATSAVYRTLLSSSTPDHPSLVPLPISCTVTKCGVDTGAQTASFFTGGS